MVDHMTQTSTAHSSLEERFHDELATLDSVNGQARAGTDPNTLDVSADQETRFKTWRRLVDAAQRNVRSYKTNPSDWLNDPEPYERPLCASLSQHVVNIEGMKQEIFPMLESDEALFEACQASSDHTRSTHRTVPELGSQADENQEQLSAMN